jgi:glycosyltransferase involved in cell wall biosynthesis
LLFLSNFYPPAGFGGYEAWCQEVADSLRARGHEVTVLTSRHDAARCVATDPPWVRRSLHLEQTLAPWANYPRSLVGRHRREQENLATLNAAIDEIAPDGVMVWGMWNLARTLAARAEGRLPDRVIYYLGDYWPTLPDPLVTFWRQPGGSLPARWIRWIAGRSGTRRAFATTTKVPLEFRHTLVCSNFLREELVRRGAPMAAAKCVAGGVDTRPFLRLARESGHEDHALSLLYVGRLVPDKGAHVLLEALGMLERQYQLPGVTLRLVGTGPADYRQRLDSIVAQHRLEQRVTFVGALASTELPAEYGRADLFAFPSIWPEPFGRVLVEAMAAELPVAGAGVGGAAEVMLPDETALVTAPGDVDALAAALARLARDPALRQRLGEAGRRRAEACFDMSRMVRDVEDCWYETLAAA